MSRKKNIFLLAISILWTLPALAQDIFFRHDKNGWEQGFQALAAGIKTASGLNPVLQLQSPPEQYQAFIQTAVAGNNTPELFTWWNGKQLESLAATGKIADLSSAWDRAVAAGYFTEEDREQVSVDGVPYGIPVNVARYPVLYSKVAFRAAGIERPPETWKELLETAEKLKAAGCIPFNAPNAGSWNSSIWFSELMIRANPDAFIGLGKGTTSYNGPEVQAAFAVWSDFADKGYFTDPREPDGSRPFAAGQSAMWLMGEWMAGPLEKLGMKPGEDFGAFIMPRINPEAEDSIVVETAIVVVSKDAFDKMPMFAAAVDYLLSPEASNALSQPPGPGIYNGNRKAKRPNAVVQEVNERIAVQHPRPIMRWWEMTPPDLQGDLLSQLGAFLLNPSAETAMKVMSAMESFNSKYWEGHLSFYQEN